MDRGTLGKLLLMIVVVGALIIAGANAMAGSSPPPKPLKIYLTNNTDAAAIFVKVWVDGIERYSGWVETTELATASGITIGEVTAQFTYALEPSTVWRCPTGAFDGQELFLQFNSDLTIGYSQG